MSDRNYDTELPENAGRAVTDDTLDKLVEAAKIVDPEVEDKSSKELREEFTKILSDHDDEMCKIWCGEY